MASTFRLKRKCFGNKGFNASTWSGLLSDNTAEGQAKKAAYAKKYATEVSNYTKNTALATTPKPTTSVSTITPKPTTPVSTTTPKSSGSLMGSWNKMSTMGKVGTGAAVAAGGYFLGKGLGLWGNKNKD